eukprot:g10219.t1
MSALSSDPTSEFSVKRLSRELATATADEEQRKLIDDTKKKAIVVAHSYEDFKNRVACANMKPLKSKELKELGNNQTHNRAFGFNTTHSSENTSAQAIFDRAARSRGELTEQEKSGKQQLEHIKSQSVPSNISELDRDWKREKEDSMRYQLLKTIGLKMLKKMLKTDAPFDLVSDILRVLSLYLSFEESTNTGENNSITKKNCKFVGKILLAMTKSPSFSMYMFSLTKDEYTLVTSIIDRFAEDSNHGGLKPESFEEVKRKFVKC